MRDPEYDGERRNDGGWFKNNQTLVVLLVIGIAAAAAFAVPKLLQPKVTIAVPPTTPDLTKAINSVLTPGNISNLVGIANQYATNLVNGRQTVVIISNQPPPNIVPPPGGGVAPAPNPPTVIGGTVIPGTPAPPSGSATGRPTLDVFLMIRPKALPAAADAPVARLSDSTDLFRAVRFKEDPRYIGHQDFNLWLKWEGKITVPRSGQHTFFHTINMNRVLPPGGAIRPTDFGGRGKQSVLSHVYVDGQKFDSKDKRFSAIKGSERTQFDIKLSGGLHEVVVWMGVVADGSRNVYDETSMTLEVRYEGDSAPVKLTARDLAW